jgi:hypothetical protein
LQNHAHKKVKDMQTTAQYFKFCHFLARQLNLDLLMKKSNKARKRNTLKNKCKIKKKNLKKMEN